MNSLEQLCLGSPMLTMLHLFGYSTLHYTHVFTVKYYVYVRVGVYVCVWGGRGIQLYADKTFILLSVVVWKLYYSKVTLWNNNSSFVMAELFRL